MMKKKSLLFLKDYGVIAKFVQQGALQLCCLQFCTVCNIMMIWKDFKDMGGVLKAQENRNNFVCHKSAERKVICDTALNKNK